MQNLMSSQRGLGLSNPRQRAWIEVKAAAIEANTRILKQVIRADCLFMAVVKADGYGHGAVTVAKAALKGGADYLGVATLQEGIELRRSGIECPILVLGNLTNKEDLVTCHTAELMPTISSLREALVCQKIAEDLGGEFCVHIKVDTGMTRLGFDFKDVCEAIEKIEQLPSLIVKGLYSHLALADVESANVTNKQQQRFQELLDILGHKKKKICCHLANSAATLRGNSLHYQMVRVGIAMYGYSPIQSLDEGLDLQPALALRARVTLVRNVPQGVGVSYGHRFITQRPSRLAVVAIGYADGVSRRLSGRISVLINNEFAPQVGAITMDQLLIDVTDHSSIEVGSVVTLLGCEGEKCISPHEWSEAIGTIPWEVLCGFKHRLPRIVI